VFLLSLTSYSLISVVAYTMLSLVLLGLGAKMYVHLMGLLKKPCSDPLASLHNLKLEVTEEQVNATVTKLTAMAQGAGNKLKSLVLMENYLDTVKFALLLYTLTFFGALMNSLTVLIFSWVLAFSLPTVYKAKKKEIDSALAVAAGHYNNLNSKLNSFLPAPAQAADQEAKKE